MKKQKRYPDTQILLDKILTCSPNSKKVEIVKGERRQAIDDIGHSKKESEELLWIQLNTKGYTTKHE